MAIEFGPVEANERSTRGVRVTFKNELQVAVVPDSVLWSLTKPDGAIVNSRNRLNYTSNKGTGVGGTLASTIVIVLYAADLAIDSRDEKAARQLVIEATFSGNLGTALPLNASYEFPVRNVPGLPTVA